MQRHWKMFAYFIVPIATPYFGYQAMRAEEHSANKASDELNSAVQKQPPYNKISAKDLAKKIFDGPITTIASTIAENTTSYQSCDELHPDLLKHGRSDLLEAMLRSESVELFIQHWLGIITKFTDINPKFNFSIKRTT